jgi:hypothetical protein
VLDRCAAAAAALTARLEQPFANLRQVLAEDLLKVQGIVRACALISARPLYVAELTQLLTDESLCFNGGNGHRLTQPCMCLLACAFQAYGTVTLSPEMPLPVWLHAA